MPSQLHPNSERPLKTVKLCCCGTVCEQAKTTRLGPVLLECGTSSGHSPLLTEQQQVELSMPAVLSNSSFIHNMVLDLKDAVTEATALDAKRPLSCCDSSWLGEGMCLDFSLIVYRCVW